MRHLPQHNNNSEHYYESHFQELGTQCLIFLTNWQSLEESTF
jgi:hypothetical protein